MGPEIRSERLTIGIGLIVAVVFGIGGSVLEAVTTQTVLYAISSMGWIAATAVLASTTSRHGAHVLAGGFLLLTVGESMLWVSGRPGGADYAAAFGGATLVYIVGLVLISAAPSLTVIGRGLAALAAVAWSAGAIRFLDGSGFAPDSLLATIGYVLTSAFFLTVALPLLRPPKKRVTAAPATSPRPVTP